MDYVPTVGSLCHPFLGVIGGSDGAMEAGDDLSRECRINSCLLQRGTVEISCLSSLRKLFGGPPLLDGACGIDRHSLFWTFMPGFGRFNSSNDRSFAGCQEGLRQERVGRVPRGNSLIGAGRPKGRRWVQCGRSAGDGAPTLRRGVQ